MGFEGHLILSQRMDEKKHRGGGRRTYDPAHMDAALHECWEHRSQHGSFPSAGKISESHGVPRSTLERLLKQNVHAHAEVPASHRPFMLSPELEKKLVIWIVIMFAMGRALYRRHVELKLYALCLLDGKAPPKVRRSKTWWRGFRKRWPALGLKRPGKLDRQRALNANPVTVARFFELLKLAMDIVQPKVLLNCDESGWQSIEYTDLSRDQGINAWSTKGNSKVFGLRGTKEGYTKTSGNRNHMTVICTIGIILGTITNIISIPLSYIFKGVRPRVDVLLKAHPNSKAAYTKKGWIVAELFDSYLLDLVNYIPLFPALMLFDGHETHIDWRMLEKAMDQGIYVLKLPSHTTHILQPLDVLIFGSFKTRWADELASWFATHNADDEPSQTDVAEMLRKAWEQATDSADKVRAAFAKPGIWPMDPLKLEREGKLSASIPTCKSLMIPQLPLTTKKWAASRDMLQSEIIRFFQDRVNRELNPPLLQQLEAQLNPAPSTSREQPLTTALDLPSPASTQAIVNDASATPDIASVTSGATSTTNTNASSSSSLPETSGSSSTAPNSSSLDPLRPTEHAARHLKVLTTIIKSEHHNRNITIEHVVPYLEAITQIAQMEAETRLLALPQAVKPKVVHGKAPVGAPRFFDRNELNRMREEEEAKANEAKEKARQKEERKRQREERKLAKATAAATRKAKGTKRSRQQQPTPPTTPATDETDPWEDVSMSEDEMKRAPEEIVLSDVPNDSSSECETDKIDHDSDDTVTEPDDMEHPEQVRKSARGTKLRKRSSFFLPS